MKNLLTSLVKLDEVNAILVSREGQPVFSYLPEFFSSEIQDVLFQSFEEIFAALDQKKDSSSQELVALFEAGSVVVKNVKDYQVLLVLKTPTPGPLVSVALNALSLKLEKLANKQQTPKVQELVPLVLFNEIVKLLAKHYGPAAKLIVKKSLQKAEATDKGLPLANVSLFLKALQEQIDESHLAQQAINKTKDLVRNWRLQ
ncbi:hypothetical protein Thein_0241 [Thermodesulfatator indicus DSM 15286]|uniref:DUF8082 domain-containing protein n=1 Tax=Thermodesulfatator indicus (strain DSM 15286 / JCM 11887 / CIR29812) TaxID=667014 RepID=F8A9H9_THEID|nr:hypothetical protein [Thermodesulfatator indicus]AEH44126.1 hypothetical protein Thein_0241 [Thermodesulfatator indicus DSM 15286]